MLVDAAGVRLWVEVTEGPRAATLLLLHGFTGTSATWTSSRDALAAGRRVIAPDLLGHGRSEAPADIGRYRMDACIDQLLAVLDHLDAPRVDVLGYSMGGRVALALALRAPARVRALVLESCSPGIRDPAERAARRARDETLADRIQKEGLEPFVDAWMAQPLFATQRRLGDAWLSRARAERLEQRPGGLANSLRALGQGAMEPSWARLGEVRAPALLVSGALDEAYTRSMDAMASGIPRALRSVVPEAGHAAHAEQPEAFAAAVRAFLDAVASRSR